MLHPPGSFAAYLKPLQPRQQAMLRALRTCILKQAPQLTECMRYGLPAFEASGKAILAIGAAKRHCSIYPMNGDLIASASTLLKDQSTSKGTIRFSLNEPLPVTLIRKLVQLCLTFNDAALASGPMHRSLPATPRAAARSRRSPNSTPSPVEALIAAAAPVHPLAINAARRVIMNVDRRIEESAKWNSPSYRLKEFFATIRLRGTGDSIQIVLHRGAKAPPRSAPRTVLSNPDPKAGTIRWADKHRCLVTLPVATNGSLSPSARAALRKLVTEWIAPAC